jgi:methyl-accepting chemotaxis protein
MKYLLSYQSVTAKIVINPLILLIIMALIACYSWSVMSKADKELKAIVETGIPLTKILTRITNYQLQQSIHLERALRYGDMIQLDEMAELSFLSEINQFDALSELVKLDLHQSEKVVKSILEINEASYGVSELARANESLMRIEKEFSVFKDHAHQVFDFYTKNKGSDAYSIGKKLTQDQERLNDELTDLSNSVDAFTKQAGLRAATLWQIFIQVIMALAIISLLFSGILSWLISRSLIHRLNHTQGQLKRIVEGNFNEQIVIQGDDEITKLQLAIVKMQKTLLSLISNIGSATSQLSKSSEQVANSMQQTSVNFLQQQSDTERVSNSMENMITAVRDVSDSVAGASGAANKANTEANSGQRIVQDTVNGIENLARQIDTTSEVVSELERDSENINTVLHVIKGIAEKTNLLALNAAIEAARAGEQGRGFAVVADEVRTLAGRTQESTAEINQIIEKLQSGARKAVAAMNESREQTQDVVTKASLAGTSLETIATSVAQINDMSSSIAVATEFQNEISDGMNTNIRQLGDITSNNSDSIQSITRSTLEVSSSAAELQRVIDSYQVSS